MHLEAVPETPPADATRRSLEQRLVEGGVEMPTRAGAHPWRLVKRRPKLVAFLYRLFT
jgi:hypothetical protein